MSDNADRQRRHRQREAAGLCIAQLEVDAVATHAMLCQAGMLDEATNADAATISAGLQRLVQYLNSKAVTRYDMP